MDQAFSRNQGTSADSAERLAQTLPRAGAMVIATKERVKNTRRIIAQSRQLVKRARQALDSSRLLRGALQRPSDER